MKEKVQLKDAKRLFSETLSEMLLEKGVTHDTYTQDEINSFVNRCVDDGYVQVWAEFMAWVEYGDDKKARTLAAIRASRLGLRR